MYQPLFILAFGAHPDDTDIGCSGTLALHAQQGLRVGVCDLTMAELSSNGTVVSRTEEARLAADRLGLHVRLCLELPDRGLTGNQAAVDAVVNVIRTYRPTFVFAPDWEDRHPDHRACAAIVEEAVFSAGLRRYGQGAPHRVTQILYYYINGISQPDVAVPIHSVKDLKQSALAAYGTQFDARVGQTATPLNQGFVYAIAGRDAIVGHQCGVPAAEGFRVKRPLQIASLAQLQTS
ncbi:MAG: bacillithiol biosynthesis deacetylase BshB1 [Alicyclobacillus sp.]|nr:bacillithiol biosynthesis deacetylase BshB1 [Alicyclobacillus sp.]